MGERTVSNIMVEASQALWNVMQPLVMPVVLLGLVMSSIGQNFEPSYEEDQYETTQQFQPQHQRFAPQPQFQQSQFSSENSYVNPKIKRPGQNSKFVDPQSVHVTPASSQGFQNPHTRFQQFAQPAARPPVRQFDGHSNQQAQSFPNTYQQGAPVQAFKQPSHQIPKARPEPVVVAPVKRPQFNRAEEEEAARRQAQSAKYSFKAAVTDGITDGQHVREEVRDGLALKGVFSYSDGFYKRTVHYEADENGYRVVKEDVQPIGNGPQEDPNGRADIQSNVGGAPLQYSITTADINTRPQNQPLYSGFEQA